MKISKFVDVVEEAGRGLADAAAEAGTDAEVPTCPGWQVRDLLRHTAMVHRWATAFVAEARTTPDRNPGETTLDGEELLAFFREGHADLVATLRAAPESLDCWAFLPAPSPLAFWARRQAHETTVHRVDAESALASGLRPVDPAFAADGIDELLRGFHARDRSRVRTPEPRTLRVRTTDTGDVWTVHLSATEPPRTVREGEEGAVDTELSGPAHQLYLALWNRLPLDAVTVTGDGGLARLWRETSAI
ncbi:maleylpyruvate isomerase family mycothiol-dependent enzyme [Streptomyces sp. NPDC053513]|uniref:Maleylpyruvate isomerase family mycothiol-dependent enzyme n=1 Tax=Streptomyces litmocidini TaxID=67318 RepID=A0ABW7UE61_9ACTN|nr:maleylpyruvate isomerase family mycothiol-dependent enzyme [Streptomyces sp. PanSC19]